MSSKKKSQTPTSNKQPQDEVLKNSGGAKGYKSDEFYNQLDEEKERLLGDIDEAIEKAKSLKG